MCELAAFILVICIFSASAVYIWSDVDADVTFFPAHPDVTSVDASDEFHGLPTMSFSETVGQAPTEQELRIHTAGWDIGGKAPSVTLETFQDSIQGISRLVQRLEQFRPMLRRIH